MHTPNSDLLCQSDSNFERIGPARIVTLIASAMLSACAVGPDYQRPAIKTASDYAVSGASVTASALGSPGNEQRFVMGRDIAFAWWQQFGSTKLNALVERALEANPTIPAAQAALKQAQEFVAAQRGYFYPSVGADFNGERQKLAGNNGGGSPGQQGNGSVIATGAGATPVVYNFYTAQLVLGFTPDVFGANRRQIESLQSQAETMRLQMEATYVTLAANVVAAILQEASLRAQIAATQSFIDANVQALDVLRSQFRLGYAMRIDLALQESAVAQARALLPPLQKQFEQTRDLVRALCGAMPDELVDDAIELGDLRLPEDLPLSIPSRLLEQRPDIRAAEEQLHAASAQVGVSISARLPQFTISGAVGGTASNVNQLFSAGGPFWNLIGDIAQPIFDGGTLMHRQRAAEQALVQAREQYRAAVIAAYQNVADTLHAIGADAGGLQAAVEAERAAKEVVDVTKKQYNSGYANFLALLSAQETYQQSVISLAQARTNRLGDTVALYQALGGGWWNRAAGS